MNLSSLITKIADRAQNAYRENRDLRWLDTPEVSRFFFEQLRERGPIAAFRFMVEREKTLGNPKTPAVVKAIMNLAGSALIAAGTRRKSIQPSLIGPLHALILVVMIHVIDDSQGATSGTGMWSCSCGATNIDIQVCGICGKKKP